MNPSKAVVRPFGPIPSPTPREVPTFESGKPVCPSGVKPSQSTSRVQNPDGTWTSVAAGAWTCGPRGFFGIAQIRPA